MAVNMNAPIKYFGGKGQMFNKIIEHFPDSSTYDTYIEPFGGSFSIGLKKPNETPIEIYNDFMNGQLEHLLDIRLIWIEKVI